MTAADPRLDELAQLLRRQGDATRDGDAEALAACSADIRLRIAALAGGAPPAAAARTALEALVGQCVRNQVLVARRQHATGKALAALRSAASMAEPAPPVYDGGGTLGWRARRPGFGPA